MSAEETEDNYDDYLDLFGFGQRPTSPKPPPPTPPTDEQRSAMTLQQQIEWEYDRVKHRREGGMGVSYHPPGFLFPWPESKAGRDKQALIPRLWETRLQRLDSVADAWLEPEDMHALVENCVRELVVMGFEQLARDLASSVERQHLLGWKPSRALARYLASEPLTLEDDLEERDKAWTPDVPTYEPPYARPHYSRQEDADELTRTRPWLDGPLADHARFYRSQGWICSLATAAKPMRVRPGESPRYQSEEDVQSLSLPPPEREEAALELLEMRIEHRLSDTPRPVYHEGWRGECVGIALAARHGRQGLVRRALRALFRLRSDVRGCPCCTASNYRRQLIEIVEMLAQCPGAWRIVSGLDEMKEVVARIGWTEDDLRRSVARLGASLEDRLRHIKERDVPTSAEPYRGFTIDQLVVELRRLEPEVMSSVRAEDIRPDIPASVTLNFTLPSDYRRFLSLAPNGIGTFKYDVVGRHDGWSHSSPGTYINFCPATQIEETRLVDTRNMDQGIEWLWERISIGIHDRAVRITDWSREEQTNVNDEATQRELARYCEMAFLLPPSVYSYMRRCNGLTPRDGEWVVYTEDRIYLGFTAFLREIVLRRARQAKTS